MEQSSFNWLMIGSMLKSLNRECDEILKYLIIFCFLLRTSSEYVRLYYVRNIIMSRTLWFMNFRTMEVLCHECVRMWVCTCVSE